MMRNLLVWICCARMSHTSISPEDAAAAGPVSANGFGPLQPFAACGRWADETPALTAACVTSEFAQRWRDSRTQKIAAEEQAIPV